MLIKDCVFSITTFLSIFHMQSIMKIASWIFVNILPTEASKCPFPLNPRFRHGLFNFLEIIFVYANPGLDAQPPCVILVP